MATAWVLSAGASSFADAEFRLRAGSVSAEDLVTVADASWTAIENSEVRDMRCVTDEITSKCAAPESGAN